ncbi:MAG TPA: hypothetical protein VMN36_04725 [Verrucomicrobiales bacterium]|nr:hypothetical protein [Verrucomicrobiales bacterium]
MDNAFRMLDLPESAALDEDLLRERFHQLSRSAHPDASGDAASFDRLSAAYQTLRSPATRLRHLLELRSASRPDLRGPVPQAWMDLFSLLSQTLRRSDQLVRQRESSASQLARALLEDQILTLQRELLELQTRLVQLQAQARSRLPGADALLAKDSTSIPDEVAQLCREFIYLERWTEQVEAHLHRFL